MTVAEIRELFCYNNNYKLSLLWSEEEVVQVYKQVLVKAPKLSATKEILIEDIREYLNEHGCTCTLKELFGV